MLFKIIIALVLPVLIATSAMVAMADAQHPIPRPQAMTEPEFDRYVEFLENTDSEGRHKLALRFEQDYPQSELLVNVYESELEYSRSHDRLREAVAAGEKALGLDPEDVKVLVDMAELAPSGTSDPADLSKAEAFARRAIVELNEMRFSREVSLSGCEDMRNSLVSRVHAALGEVFGKRGEYAEAIKELETAVALSPAPSGPELLLAGKLYRLVKRDQDAREMFRRAALAGPAAIRSIANSELVELGRNR